MENKQTAVEWLFHKLWDEPKDKFTWYPLREKALEMEKEQIEESYCQGCKDITENDEIFPRVTAEEYYNKTFKK